MLKKRRQSWPVLLLLGATVWFPLVVHAETARWNLDPDHSTIEFRVTHMVVSKTTGRFTDYAGFIDMDGEAGNVKEYESRKTRCPLAECRLSRRRTLSDDNL